MFIVVLLTISVSSYFFYLDIIYKDKLVKEDVSSLYKLKKVAGRPVIEFANPQEVNKKNFDYNQIIKELNLDAMAITNKKIITINLILINIMNRSLQDFIKDLFYQLNLM